MAGERTFDIFIKGDATSALAAFKATQLAALKTKATTGGALTKMGAVAATAGIVGVGAMIKLGASFDKAWDTIRIRTGATGDRFKQLQSDFKGVARQSSADFGTISEALTGVNRRLGITGKPLQDLTRQFIFLDKRGLAPMATTIPAMTRVFGDWGIKTKEQIPTMDKFFRASQQTGIGVDRLGELMVQFGAPLRSLGLGFDESVAMLSKFEKEGVNLQTAMPGLRMALKNFAAAGKEPKQALLDTIGAIKSAKDPLAAMKIGFEVFGKRAGPDLVTAIREGRLDLDKLIGTISGGKDTIFKAGKETASFGQKWGVIKNRVFVALEPIATKLFTAIGVGLDVLSNPRWSSSIGILVAALGGLAIGVKLVTLVMHTNPIILFATALIVAGVAAYTFRDQIMGAFKTVLDWLKANWPKILVILTGPMGLVVVAIVRHWDKISSAFTRGFDFVRDTVMNIVGWLKVNWPLIVGVFLGPIALVVAVIHRHWGTIHDAFRAGVRFVTSTWSAGWTAVKDFMVNTAAAIVRTITGWRDTIIQTFANALTWLIEGGRNILRGLWSGIKEIWNREVAFWTNLAQAIKDKFAGARDWLLEGGKNIVRGMWKGIKEIWSSVVEWFKDLPGKILSVLGISSPPGWAIEAGRWILRGITKGLGLGIGSVMDFMSGIAGKFTGALKDAWSGLTAFVTGDIDLGANISGFIELGKRMAAAVGWTGGNWQALQQLWAGESGWNPSAYNKSSGASGIPQALPASKMGTTAQLSNPNVMQRAAAQIAWGLNYIKDRYGNPISALQFWNAHTPHWYAAGGVHQRTELVGVHAGEMTLNMAQQSRLFRLANARGAAAPVVVNVGGIHLVMPRGVTAAEARQVGGAAAKGFLDVLAQRRVMTDARIT